MLRLVVKLEAIVGFVQVFWGVELMCRRGERPEIRSKDHDRETDVVWIWCSFLTLLELIRHVSTETDV